jgi:hypothetical protein
MRGLAGTGRSAVLGTASGTDLTLQVTAALSARPTGGSVWLYLAARRHGSGAEYRLKVRFDPSGAVAVGLSRVGGTTEISIATETAVPGLTVSAGQWLRIRGEVIGSGPTQLRIKAWTGSAEPPGWQLTATDTTTELQSAGSVGLRTYLGGTVSNGPLVLQVDDYVVAAPGVSPPPPPPPPAGVVIAGAGDIAGCPATGAGQTAAVLDAVAPSQVFTVGDNAYPNGTAADFTCFESTWGRFKPSMIPVPGNHEYNTPGAPGYYDYFGVLAGPRGLGYYAKDVGTWRVYALNTECTAVDCAAEATWLANDLAANPRQCVVGIWHEPRFSSGPHGDASWVAPFYQALYNAGAEVVLNGHDHHYERFDPMDPNGTLDATRGLREFIVGTGGIGSTVLNAVHANSAARQTGTFGVLKLTLRAASYDWEFVPVAGRTFTDSGTASCH